MMIVMSIVVVSVISEEVAFYQGNRKEQAIINTTLHRLVSPLHCTLFPYIHITGF